MRVIDNRVVRLERRVRAARQNVHIILWRDGRTWPEALAENGGGPIFCKGEKVMLVRFMRPSPDGPIASSLVERDMPAAQRWIETHTVGEAGSAR